MRKPHRRAENGARSEQRSKDRETKEDNRRVDGWVGGQADEQTKEWID